MYETLWEDTKAVAKWVWNWITVLTASLMGLLVYLPDLLGVFAANIQPLLPPDKAGAIIAVIGIVKGLITVAQSWRDA